MVENPAILIDGASEYPAPGLVKLIALSLPSLEILATPIAVVPPEPTDPTIVTAGGTEYPSPSLSIRMRLILNSVV